MAPKIRFSRTHKCFVAGRQKLKGAHTLLEMWYPGFGRFAAGGGSFCDRNNHAIGKKLGPGLARWMKRVHAGTNTAAAFAKDHATVRLIAQICAQQGWYPIGVDFAVGDVACGAATGVDLVVRTRTGGVVLAECKVVAQERWRAEEEALPEELVGKSGARKCPANAAVIQLEHTANLFRRHCPREKVESLVVLHAYYSTAHRGFVCAAEQMPEWSAKVAGPALEEKLEAGRR